MIYNRYISLISVALDGCNLQVCTTHRNSAQQLVGRLSAGLESAVVMVSLLLKAPTAPTEPSAQVVVCRHGAQSLQSHGTRKAAGDSLFQFLPWKVPRSAASRYSRHLPPSRPPRLTALVFWFSVPARSDFFRYYMDPTGCAR